MGSPRPRPVVLDAGALIQFDRGDARMRALVRLALEQSAPLVVPAGEKQFQRTVAVFESLVAGRNGAASSALKDLGVKPQAALDRRAAAIGGALGAVLGAAETLAGLLTEADTIHDEPKRARFLESGRAHV